MAGITLALKLGYIAQLTALAIEVGQAVVTAFATAGATLAEMPGWIALTRVACRMLLDKTLALIEREIAAALKHAATLLEKVGQKDIAKTVLTKSKNTAFRGIMHEVEHLDVGSPLNGANFYSGFEVATKTPMRTVAEKNTDGIATVTLEQTRGGSELDARQLFDQNTSPVTLVHAQAIWARTSERYAANAEGNIIAWRHNPRPQPIWETHELPALLNNPKVNSITVVDPTTGVRSRIK